ncbi:MAG TPA: hypothetical protein VHC19_16130 [Pirellulales bacterium]|nr:hypothetical protein [Pirellulales bacterium]
MHAEVLQFLRQIRGNPRGQIIVRRYDIMVGLVALICEYCPNARIFIVAANREKVARLARRLQPLLARPITWGDQEPWNSPVWLHVETADMFVKGFNADWHMVLFSDIESAIARQTLETADRACDLIIMRTQWRYCFIPASRRLHSDSRLKLEAIVGPEIYREPASTTQLRDVQLLLVRAPLVPAAASYDSPLERKRSLIWANSPRNAVIATIAQGFADGDLPGLWQHGLLLDIADIAELQSDELSVAILVESPEHGRHLLQLLPGWRLAGMVPSEEHRRQAPMPCGNRTIATFEKARRVGCSVDVIIRADGTGTQWHQSFGPYRTSASDAGNLMVVDFRDDVDPQAQHDTRRRLDDYAAHGWLLGSHEPGCHAATVQPAYREDER